MRGRKGEVKGGEIWIAECGLGIGGSMWQCSRARGCHIVLYRATWAGYGRGGCAGLRRGTRGGVGCMGHRGTYWDMGKERRRVESVLQGRRERGRERKTVKSGAVETPRPPIAQFGYCTMGGQVMSRIFSGLRVCVCRSKRALGVVTCLPCAVPSAGCSTLSPHFR